MHSNSLNIGVLDLQLHGDLGIHLSDIFVDLIVEVSSFNLSSSEKHLIDWQTVDINFYLSESIKVIVYIELIYM